MNKVEKYQKLLKQAQKIKDQAAGAKKQVLQDLEHKFKIKSLQEIEDLLDKEKKELSNLLKKAEKEENQFMEKWKDELESLEIED